MTAILGYLKRRWLLWLGIVVFVCYKLPALHYLFYWDESWSYEAAVKLMYAHGPSMMPNAIDTNFSRGHPLLFYFLVSAWMHLFGPGSFSQHIFALLVSVLRVVATYLYDSLKEVYKGKIVYRTEHNGLWGEVYKIK